MTRYVKTCDVRIKAEGDGLAEGEFEALVSVFGNVDRDGERVVKGAFADTIKAWKDSGDPLPVIWSHQKDDPASHVGEVLEIEERDEGLWIKGRFDAEDLEDRTSRTAKVHRLVKGRRVRQWSFAYEVLEDRKAPDARELLRLALFEVGPTLIGANGETDTLGAKEHGAKRGRVLSAKNEAALNEARDGLKAILSTIDGVLAQLGRDDDEPKATSPGQGPGSTTDEEPPAGAKSERSAGRSPASVLLALEIHQLDAEEALTA